MSAEQEVISKSARKRANAKAREAEAAAPEPPAPAPKAKAAAKGEAAPKAKAKAKAEAAPAPAPEAKAKAKGKAKAEPKAAAAPEPAPKAEAKAKAKGKAAPAPAAPEGSAAAKPKAKSKAKAKAEAEKPVRKESAEVASHIEMDDGAGGDWEVASAVSKKQQKRQEKQEEQEKIKKEEAIAAAKAAKAAEKAAANQPVNKKAAAKGSEIIVKKVSEAVVSSAAVAAKVAEPEKPVVIDTSVSAQIQVPQEKIGRVIGPKGANIALIKEKTGVKTVDTAGDLVTIVGDEKEQVIMAEAAIRELIERGYMSLAFEDFKQGEVSVKPTSIPDIIGSRGAIIQVIKKECKVEIDIPPVPKNAPQGKKVKVNIAGGAEGVAKATEIVEAIDAHQHHEVTHPGFTHAEMEVEEWRYRFIIGKGGSEMRHIQNNFKVKVNIPRDGGEDAKVLIVGEARDVERAVKYIEKILFDAEQAPKGRGDKEKAEDTWGDEPPEEAWMSAYMYKRGR